MKLSALLLFAGTALAVAGAEFTGTEGQIAKGWSYYQAKTFVNYTKVKPAGNPTGLVANPDKDTAMLFRVSGVGLKAEPEWNLSGPSNLYEKPGIVEVTIVGKSAKGTQEVKALIVNDKYAWWGEQKIRFQEDWTTQKVYYVMPTKEAPVKKYHLRMNVPANADLTFKTVDYKVLPYRGEGEIGFIGNEGEYPILWKQNFKPGTEACGLTEDEGMADAPFSMRIQATPADTTTMERETLVVAPGTTELEFSVWMKGTCQKGVSIFLLGEGYKWWDKKTVVPSQEWKQYTFKYTIKPEYIGKKYWARIDVGAGGDVLICKYYVGPARPESK